MCSMAATKRSQKSPRTTPRVIQKQRAFAKRLRQARKAKRLSVEVVSARSGDLNDPEDPRMVSVTTIYILEQAKAKPTDRTLNRLVKALWPDTTLEERERKREWLLTGKGEP